MNKFIVFSCIDLKKDEEAEYDGTIVALANTSDPTFMLFFPVSPENAKIINYVLDGREDKSVKTDIIEIYETMLDSWRAGQRYLSGIIMDMHYDPQMDKSLPMIRLILSDDSGVVDSLVYVNLIHAVILASIEKIEIMISDRFLEMMLPETDESMERLNQRTPEFPEDKRIVDLARKIMEGKIKDN